MGPEIEKVLVASTAHMPDSFPDFGEMRTASHEYGYIVFLLSSHPSPEASGNLDRAPTWMRPIVRVANMQGCNYINFDRDADTLDGVPIFDW